MVVIEILFALCLIVALLCFLFFDKIQDFVFRNLYMPGNDNYTIKIDAKNLVKALFVAVNRTVDKGFLKLSKALQYLIIRKGGTKMNLSSLQKKMLIGISGGFTVLCIILSVVFYSIGTNKAISEETARITLAKNEEYTELVDNLVKIKSELKSEQELFDEFNDYKTNKEAKTLEIQQLDADISVKSSELTSLNISIESKNAELERLTNAVIKTGEAPKVIQAGHYSVGTDLQPGRYTVTGSSNFVVYSASGRLKVNTILGDWGVESYTCELSSGDTMKLSAKTTFTPVK